MKLCPNCNIQLKTRRGIRCKSCSKKGNLNGMYGKRFDNVSKCLIQECQKQFYAKNYCRNHYRTIVNEEGKKRHQRSYVPRICVKQNLFKTCLQCHIQMMIAPWQLLSKKFCSYQCKAFYQLTVFSWEKPTSIEVKLYEELNNQGLLFEKQYLVNNKFLVDAYIPSLNLVIEADGNYWHSLEKTVKKDRSENAYLTKCGYGLLRLTETEINNGSFKERLKIVKEVNN